VTRSRSRRWWWGFALFSAFLVAGLVRISMVTLELEEQNRLARAETRQREQLRDALWTLDGWLGQVLGDEASRPSAGDWFAPLPGQAFATPLVGDSCALFNFRFESDPLNGLTNFSPTIPPETPPESGKGATAQQLADTSQWIASNDLSQVYQEAEMLACTVLELPQQVDAGQLGAVQIELDPGGQQRARMQQQGAAPPQTSPGIGSAPEAQILVLPGAPPPPAPQVRPSQGAGTQSAGAIGYGNPVQTLDVESQSRRNISALKARSQRQAKEDAALFNRPDPRIEETGVLFPTWRRGAVGLELLFLRRILGADGVLVQGIAADWATLERELLALATPILPGLHLEPLEGNEVGDLRWVGSSLGTIPVGLALPPVELPAAAELTPARLALALTWLAVLGAIAVAFASLRASVAFGERRSRFASAVTHELRTPLTTFQLYSEMLADGMVVDPEQRKQYLETLRGESQRLSGLVESVLAYARLEDGRESRRRETIPAGALLEHSRARWQECLARAGLELAVEVEDGETPLFTDPEAVGQILGNLVENAAKYAREGEPKRVEITVARPAKGGARSGANGGDRADGSSARSGPLEIAVRDFGPGIAPENAKRIFSPFDRAGRESGTLPGAGLGLSIARALARDLGGDLRLDETVSPGARFVLTLPGGS